MTRMHNNVHNWVRGHMAVVPAAINDPVFSLHHCNVDRILESWMRRFTGTSFDSALLPAYVPVTGGHPGHGQVENAEVRNRSTETEVRKRKYGNRSTETEVRK